MDDRSTFPPGTGPPGMPGGPPGPGAKGAHTSSRLARTSVLHLLGDRKHAHAGPTDRVAETNATLLALRAGKAVGKVNLAGAHLVDEDLSGLDLTGANLSGCDLSRAKLEGTTLLRANLSGACLFHARLAEADLTGANLTGANLQGASLTGAGLGRADLSGASLVEADLRGTTLVDARLVGADLRMADLSGARARGADWTNADLRRTRLHRTELKMGEMRGARFDGADLRHVHLQGIRSFRKASWLGVDIRGIDFTGAYLCRSFIHDQNYLEEFRNQSAFSNLVYKVWWLTSDCGRSALRWSVCTFVLIILYAWLYSFVELNYGSSEAGIGNLYYSVVTMTTLGYGDIVPASTGARWMAMSEVMNGYVMLGGLLSIFSNKMARRAD